MLIGGTVRVLKLEKAELIDGDIHHESSHAAIIGRPADNTQASGQRQQSPILTHIMYHKNYKKKVNIPVFLHDINL